MKNNCTKRKVQYSQKKKTSIHKKQSFYIFFVIFVAAKTRKNYEELKAKRLDSQNMNF